MFFRWLLPSSLCLLFVSQCLYASTPVSLSVGVTPFCEVERKYLNFANHTPHIPSIENNKLDASCFVNAGDIRLDDFILVDIRHGSEEILPKLQNFIRLSGDLLLQSEQYKNHPILIASSGLALEESSRFCSKLRDNGFIKAYIVRGGARAFTAYHPSFIEGQSTQFGTIEPNTLFRLSFANTFNVYADSRSASLVEDILGEMISVIPFSFSDQDALTALVESVDSQIVLIPDEYYSLPLLVQKSPMVFWLKGGVKAIEQTRNMFNASAKKRMEIPNRYRCKA
jgi:hypothetical protein